MEIIKFKDLYNADDKAFSPNLSIIKINAEVSQLAYLLLTTTDSAQQEAYVVALTRGMAGTFINLMRRSYDDKMFAEVMKSIETDINNVYEFFDKKDIPTSLRYFAFDIGLNSENDNNYSATTKLIELFALSKKFGLEFDFSWDL